MEFIFSRFIRLHYHLWSAMFMFFYWCWRQSWSHFSTVLALCFSEITQKGKLLTQSWVNEICRPFSPCISLHSTSTLFDQFRCSCCSEVPPEQSFRLPQTRECFFSWSWNSLINWAGCQVPWSQKRLMHGHCTIKSWLMSAAETVVLQAGSSAYAHNLCLINH